MEEQLTTQSQEQTNNNGNSQLATSTALSEKEREQFNEFKKRFFENGKLVPVKLTAPEISMLFIVDVKDKTFKAANNYVLKAQGLANKLKQEIDVDDANEKEGKQRILSIAAIEERIKEIYLLYDKMEGKGGFCVKYRNMIRERLVHPASEISNNIDPDSWKDYQNLNEKLRQLKKADKEKDQININKEKERKAYIAHLKNYNAKATAIFKEMALREIYEMKKFWLGMEETSPDKQQIKDAIATIALIDEEYFEFKYLQPRDIYGNNYIGVEPVKVEDLIKSAQDSVDALFSTYFQDLNLVRNSTKKDETIAKCLQDITNLRNKIASEAKIEQAANVLKSTVSTSVEVKKDYKEIKEIYTVRIETEEDELSMLQLWCSKPEVRELASELVDREKRTDKQRCAAFAKYADKTGTLFAGIKYSTKEK